MTTTTETLRKDVNDLGITILATKNVSERDDANVISVEMKVYEIEGTGFLPNNGPLWHKAGSYVYPDPVDTLEAAEPFLEGYVKWDGCSHWMFSDNKNNTMLHLCGRDEVEKLGRQLSACWDWADELLGERNREIRR